MTTRDVRADLLHTGHVVHGGALLLRPAVAARADVAAADGRTETVVRVLGARHVLHGLAGLGAPRWVTPGVGAMADGVHAASMVGLAALGRDHRRGALVSAVVAAAFALAAWWAARGG
ncbi:hypothetical protein [Actinomycetospora chibensis]|uniref:Uncharacterized protein n=1 Tax=Actinomycetospora chibensis TaxID=663606 RepID=A0ABV9RRQ4_9PSEU|nr:hypothetical protein [Actinomycetospora chibensis]MDD7923255.1 hypothetical protein [Actinomycetospora chibensis]